MSAITTPLIGATKNDFYVRVLSTVDQDDHNIRIYEVLQGRAPTGQEAVASCFRACIPCTKNEHYVSGTEAQALISILVQYTPSDSAHIGSEIKVNAAWTQARLLWNAPNFGSFQNTNSLLSTGPKTDSMS